MSVLSTLITNINKVRFASLFPPDKIAYEDTYSQTLAGGGTTATATMGNPYGVASLITLAWSIDNVNFYPAQAYTAASAPYTANGWCDASTIYLYMENFSAGTVTFYLHFTLDSVT